MNRNLKGQFDSNKNHIEISDYIYCYHPNGELLFFTDLEMLDIVTSHSWAKLANGYAGANIDKVMVGVHRIITNCPKGMLVDHINRNKKDNRICNLRICNKSQNAYNTTLNRLNKSGYKGVYFRKDTKKWVAEIKHNYKKHCLGCFNSKEEAIEARKKYESIYAGDYICQ